MHGATAVALMPSINVPLSEVGGLISRIMKRLGDRRLAGSERHNSIRAQATQDGITGPIPAVAEMSSSPKRKIINVAGNKSVLLMLAGQPSLRS